VILATVATVVALSGCGSSAKSPGVGGSGNTPTTASGQSGGYGY
jgi:hypothetical protein